MKSKNGQIFLMVRGNFKSGYLWGGQILTGKELQGNFWSIWNVLYFDSGGVHIYKIHQAIPLRWMHFAICMLHVSKDVEKSVSISSLHAGVIFRNSLTPRAFAPHGIICVPPRSTLTAALGNATLVLCMSWLALPSLAWGLCWKMS